MHRTYASIANQSQMNFDKLGVWLTFGKHTGHKSSGNYSVQPETPGSLEPGSLLNKIYARTEIRTRVKSSASSQDILATLSGHVRSLFMLGMNDPLLNTRDACLIN